MRPTSICRPTDFWTKNATVDDADEPGDAPCTVVWLPCSVTRAAVFDSTPKRKTVSPKECKLNPSPDLDHLFPLVHRIARQLQSLLFACLMLLVEYFEHDQTDATQYSGSDENKNSGH